MCESVDYAVRVEGDQAQAEDEYAITRGQNSHLALDAHDIFCDTGLDFRYGTFEPASVL